MDVVLVLWAPVLASIFDSHMEPYLEKYLMETVFSELIDHVLHCQFQFPHLWMTGSIMTVGKDQLVYHLDFDLEYQRLRFLLKQFSLTFLLEVELGIPSCELSHV